MLVYKDVITKDELFSDAFPMREIDDIVIEVDCQDIMIKKGADVDIGANPSAEDQDEALEDGAEQVNNVVHSFRLQQTQFNKKSFITYLKTYMKAIKSHLQTTKPDRVAVFEKGAAAYASKIISKIDDYVFFTGESMDTEGMVALLNYREDGITPYFTFWKDGLLQEKQ